MASQSDRANGNLNPNQTVLVSNKGNYWCEGMPIVVTEVQIASQAGDEEHVYLNIALQNLASQPVVGIYYDVICYNLLKQELEGISNQALLDLSIGEGQHWFTTSSIRLPDSTTRRCTLTIRNVVLANEEIWSNEQSAQLVELPKAQPLALASELAEEYHLRLCEQQQIRNASAVYTATPSFGVSYWHCSCGQLNTTATNCVCCGMGKATLAGIFDEGKLRASHDHRIAEKLRIEEERRQRIAEQTEAVKQKSLEISGQATATAGKWFATAQSFILSNRKPIGIGCAAAAGVLVIGLGIFLLLDGSSSKPPVTSSNGSSDAVTVSGSAAPDSSQPSTAEQQNAEAKRKYDVAQAKAYGELLGELMQTSQYDFGEGRLAADGAIRNPSGSVYGEGINSNGVYVDDNTPAIFFTQLVDMDNDGTQELVLLVGNTTEQYIDIWGFDGTDRKLISTISVFGEVSVGRLADNSYYIYCADSSKYDGVVTFRDSYYGLVDGALQVEELEVASKNYANTSELSDRDDYYCSEQKVTPAEYRQRKGKYRFTTLEPIVKVKAGLGQVDIFIDSGRLFHGATVSLQQTLLDDLALQEGKQASDATDLLGVWTSFSAYSGRSAVHELALNDNSTFTSLRWVKDSDSFGYRRGCYLLAGDTLYMLFDGDSIDNVKRVSLLPSGDTFILPAEFFAGDKSTPVIRELWRATDADRVFLKVNEQYRNG